MKTLTYVSIELSHLVDLVEALSAHLDRSDATISTWIVGNARLFARARNGRGCTASTYRDVMLWFDKHWPEDLEWPSSVPRPVSVEVTDTRGAA